MKSDRHLLIWALALLVSSGLAVAPAGVAQEGDDRPFSERVDLTPLGRVAVHTSGRLKSFDSFALSIMQEISGPHRINGHSPSYTYFDMMLRESAYRDADVIYVKNKSVRAGIRGALERSLGAPLDANMQERLHGFIDSGLISEQLLRNGEVQHVLSDLRADVLRTAKYVNMIDNAVAIKQSRVLMDLLSIVPPPGGDQLDPWMTLDQFAAATFEGGAKNDQTMIAETWRKLVLGWFGEKSEDVNEAVETLATLLPQINPDVYPAQQKLEWESRYFRWHNLTWIWIIYALSIVPLLLSIVYQWKGARYFGLGLFLVAFLLHTGSLIVRWYVSGRWPNTNMFEAVTTAAWFGSCFAVVLEIWLRRSPMRNFIALGAAVASMAALMATKLFPLALTANISNRMPVLHDIWLYIHTNVIIFSYCLIFMAAVSALLYVIYRLAGGGRDYAKAGGAASLIMVGPKGGSYLGREKSSLGQVLDGTTMVLMEMSFIMLWAGLVMGAIWADHSWGRPWGWDPKEVFALNTFLVFAVLVHGRLKVKDKGMWTALVALFGCAVMLFNWIVVNFVISGLHSYA